ncbi:PLP-dependent transferase [Neoconidiobolus thromboides FSU 785]|nr:PLP-dependent transferase [Neoconidiobolus thromboides FSU 785]
MDLLQDSSQIPGQESIFYRVITYLAYLTESIPFSKRFWKYLYDSHQNDPIPTILELFLIFFALHYVFAKAYRINSNEIKLTEGEIDELVTDWQPEPLSEELSEMEKFELNSIPVVTGPFSSKQKSKDGKTYLNIANFNFLNMLNSDKIKTKAIETVQEYGVGTCGPTGFYGTLDLHVQLEQDIANFLGTEGAILYSQGFSTLSSVIPCFSKRGDFIICDDGVNFSIQKGVQISRSNVRYFKHNDMEDLKRIMEEVRLEDKKKPGRLVSRRFLITEGIFYNTGDLCPLPELVKLKYEYKYRLIIDESISFGILGSRGKGISEHFGLPITDIDIISGSLTNSVSGSGGFAASTADIVERQRLAGQSYVFSASLPAALTVTDIEGIKELTEEGPAKLLKLRENISIIKKLLNNCPHFVPLDGTEFMNSPLLHIRIQKHLIANYSILEESKLLQEIVDECLKDGVMTSRAKYHPTQEIKTIQPSIRFNVSIALTTKELEKCFNSLKSNTQKILSKKKLI